MSVWDHFRTRKSEPGPRRPREAQGSQREARETILAQEWPEHVRKRPSGTICGRGNWSPARSGPEKPREAQGKPEKPSWHRNCQNVSENVRLGPFSDEEIGARPVAAPKNPGKPKGNPGNHPGSRITRQCPKTSIWDQFRTEIGARPEAAQRGPGKPRGSQGKQPGPGGPGKFKETNGNKKIKYCQKVAGPKNFKKSHPGTILGQRKPKAAQAAPGSSRKPKENIENSIAQDFVINKNVSKTSPWNHFPEDENPRAPGRPREAQGNTREPKKNNIAKNWPDKF